jgi:competence ComEA-like helix-hairpin-helix protein
MRGRRRWLRLALSLVVSLAAGSIAAQKKHPPDHPLDLNSATVKELQQLPGIGPTTAQAIVDFRVKSGPFRRVEDLLAIPKITKERLEKIKPYVKVVPPGTK